MTYGRANATLAFMAGAPWTDAENDKIVADYFAMLKQHLEGRPYTKAEHNRQLQGLIGRSRESIEFKHQKHKRRAADHGRGLDRGIQTAQ